MNPFTGVTSDTYEQKQSQKKIVASFDYNL